MSLIKKLILIYFQVDSYSLFNSNFKILWDAINNTHLFNNSFEVIKNIKE